MVLWKYLSHISLPSVLAPLSGMASRDSRFTSYLRSIFSQLSSNSSTIEKKAVQYTLLKPWAASCQRSVRGLTDVKDDCVSLEILKHPEAGLKVLCSAPERLDALLGTEGCGVPFSPVWPAASLPSLIQGLISWRQRVVFGAFVNMSLEVGYFSFLILRFLSVSGNHAIYLVGLLWRLNEILYLMLLSTVPGDISVQSWSYCFPSFYYYY